jgi:hypothetical protein
MRVDRAVQHTKYNGVIIPYSYQQYSTELPGWGTNSLRRWTFEQWRSEQGLILSCCNTLLNWLVPMLGCLYGCELAVVGRRFLLAKYSCSSSPFQIRINCQFAVQNSFVPWYRSQKNLLSGHCWRSYQAEHQSLCIRHMTNEKSYFGSTMPLFDFQRWIVDLKASSTNDQTLQNSECGGRLLPYIWINSHVATAADLQTILWHFVEACQILLPNVLRTGYHNNGFRYFGSHRKWIMK